ncbi:MAG: hypothetical protein UV29_C0010G0021 [Candidatus Collierbacteria bacterium GW2011_GWD2_42_50]|nr:MAG: hypothetical protein UV30_C0013G0005 [Candidatus Collierbacteria bacterium GW2011_GWF1_42_50]KKS62786.1 MAG: hypothetical protein UV29_C0010G0021 [Candidatus Collierbacteria bacterium GW2011_GWD2_42_50]
MMNNLSFMPVYSGMAPLIVILVLSDLILKGVALFKSAQRDQKVWFVALLLVNSLGILPIIYLIVNGDIRLTTPAKKKRK